MNTILTSSLALALVSSTSFANDNAWATLDQEIAGLSSSLTAQDAGSGPKIGGWMTTTLTSQADGIAPGTDKLGFDLWKVRLEVSGNAPADSSYKISFDFAPNGTADLKDAWVKTKLAESFDLQMGRFKNPVLRSVLISDNKLLFVKRTLIGQAFDDRFTGAMATGKFEMLTVNLAVQNSARDFGAQADDQTITVRAEGNVMGKGAGSVEGAYGASDTNNLTVGAFFQDDSSADNGTSMGFDAYLTMGPIAVSGEIVDIDDNYDNADVALDGGTTPWDITAEFMLSDNWSIAGRYEDTDKANNLTQASGGLNYYVNGHSLKWGLLYIMQDADDGSQAEDQLVLEATIAF